MFEISVKTHFSAAHHLVGYNGECANPHGHNWEVEIFMQGEHLNGLGILVDFRDLKNSIREVLGHLDHVDLNKLPDFESRNPTSENLARYIYLQIGARLNDHRVRVSRVRVTESPTSSSVYWE